VDRSFSMKGFGTVVTGTVFGGTVATGEEVAILPGGTVAKVRGLQVHGGPVERSAAGTRTAVNLQGVEKESAPRGSVLCHPGTFSPTKSAEVFVEYLPLVPKPLRHRGQISFHAGTFSCVGRILLYGQAEIQPGGSGYGRVLLSEETVLAGGDRFILRGFSPLANFGYTVGGGAVLHPNPPVRREVWKAVPEALPRLRSEDPAERVLATVEDASAAGVTPADAAVVAGIGAERTGGILKELVAKGMITEVSGPGKIWSRSAISAASSFCAQALTKLHDRNPERDGFPREEIASLFPIPPDSGFLAMALEGNASISRQGDLYFLPARKPKAVELGSPLARRIAEFIRAAGGTAPGRAELLEAVKGVSADPKAVEKVVEGLARAGEIVRVKELLFDGAALRGIEERVVAFLAKQGEITVPEFKEMTGLSRKYIIPLLEHFDATKVTLRVGDKRVLRKK
jgi:selenocysteine-specific elongation factor